MKIWLRFIFLLPFAFANENRPSSSIRNDFGNRIDGQHIEISILSKDEATSLFREFQMQTQIPFRFPLDGCYARATEMARIAERKGYDLGKVFALGQLRAKTNLAKFPQVQWGWHVAPVVFVGDLKGAKQLMVLDPSLFNEPVALDVWKKKMLEPGDPPAKIEDLKFGTRFQYRPYKMPNFMQDVDQAQNDDDSEPPKQHWIQKDLENSDATLKAYKPLEDQNATNTFPNDQTPQVTQ